MNDSLWDDSVKRFRERIATTAPTPGGGAVAAVTSVFAVALLRMVCEISMKKLEEAKCCTVETLLGQLASCEDVLARSADNDVLAFDTYAASRKARDGAGSEALLVRCANVPMSAAEIVAEVQSLLPQIESFCPLFARSDLTTAACLLRAGRESLLANVEINLDAMRDEVAKHDMRRRYNRLNLKEDNLP